MAAINSPLALGACRGAGFATPVIHRCRLQPPKAGRTGSDQIPPPPDQQPMTLADLFTFEVCVAPSARLIHHTTCACTERPHSQGCNPACSNYRCAIGSFASHPHPLAQQMTFRPPQQKPQRHLQPHLQQPRGKASHPQRSRASQNAAASIAAPRLALVHWATLVNPNAPHNPSCHPTRKPHPIKAPPLHSAADGASMHRLCMHTTSSTGTHSSARATSPSPTPRSQPQPCQHGPAPPTAAAKMTRWTGDPCPSHRAA